MATLAQIALKSADALTDAERDKVREILDFEAHDAGTDHADLETRFDALAGELNQRLKAYIDDWDRISVQPVQLAGGTDAINYSTAAHELKVRNRVRLLLGYTAITSGGAGQVRRIPVTAAACPPWYD